MKFLIQYYLMTHIMFLPQISSPLRNIVNVLEFTQSSMTSILSLVVPKKKIMENSILGPDPPVMEKCFLFFFLKLDHFLRTYCKKCIFTIENPKKI